MSLDSLGRNKRFKNRPARLLHVGPLRLDEPAEGLPGLPERLRNLNAAAAEAAMIRTFDAAIEHDVDAVILSGGFPDPERVGFRGLALAYEQCRRLIDHRIPVIATENRTPTGSRFAYLRKPANVHFINDSWRNAITIGDIDRRSRLDIGSPSMVSNARLRVVVCDEPESEGRIETKCEAEYVALGKQANPTQWPQREAFGTTRDAGSPQGRGTSETGVHGALLVTLGRGEKPIVQTIACDVIRHHNLVIEPPVSARIEQLHQALWAQAEELRTDHSVQAHFVHWTIRNRGELSIQPVRTDLLDAIRGAFATPASGPAIWSVSIDLSLEPARTPVSEATCELDGQTSIDRYVQALDSHRPRHRNDALTWAVPLLV